MRHIWLVIAFAASAACSNAPAEGDCEKLLDHTVQLQLSEAGAAADTAKAEKLKATAAEEFLEQCRHRIPKERVDCALKAKTKQELAACDAA